MPFDFSGIGDFGVTTKQGQSLAVYGTGNTIIRALLSSSEVKGNDNDVFRYYLNLSDSADTFSESYWEEVRPDETHTFTHTGKWMRWRIILIGYGGTSTYIDWLKIAVTEQT